MSLSTIKYPYIVVLKNSASWHYNVMGFLLNTASCLFFAKEFIFVETRNLILVIGVVLLAGILLFNLYRLRKGQKLFFNYAYLLSVLLWMKMPYLQWLLVPFLLLAILERQVKFPLEIGFSESQVVFNTLFKRKYDWNQLSNVVLRDGLLTIDFKNNRLLQREVDDDEDEEEVSEEEFNAFCRAQLQKNVKLFME